MKSPVSIFACVCLAIACTRIGSALTVEQARNALRKGEERTATIVGYYCSHFEGDQIEMQPGDQTGDGISLVFGSRFAGEKTKGRDLVRALGGRYDQKYVMVTGILKRGVFPGALGMLSDHVFIDVAEIKVPDTPPMSPKAYRQ